MSVFLVCLLVLVAIGIGVTLIATRAPQMGTDSGEGSPRLQADLHLASEQISDHLVQKLRRALERPDVGDSQLHVELPASGQITIRARSETGQAFRAHLTLHSRRHHTELQYALVRLPGNERIHQQVRDLDLILITALHNIDPQATVTVSNEASQELSRPRPISAAHRSASEA